MSDHTPTPWALKGNELIGPAAAYIIRDYGAYDGIHWNNFGELPPEECEANKRFIVRAVNAHDALVGAVRMCPCPRPGKGQSPDEEAGACFDKGICGCVYGSALELAGRPRIAETTEPGDGE